MARQGGKKKNKSGASTSGVDWGKITTIAVAVTAVSGALVTVSGNLSKLISAFSDGAADESTASAAPAANPAAQAPAKAEAVSVAVEPPVRGARFVRRRDGSEETLCAPGQNLVGGDCVWPPRVVAPRPCPPGWERYRGRCEEPPRMPVPGCPPGWTRDADGVCQAPPPPPVGTRQCPDGSSIPAAQECPRPQVNYSDTFIIFFDWDRDQITPAAAAILDNAAAGYRQVGSASVALAAHADRSGSGEYNVGLSQRRANAVRTYLAGRGVPDAAITSEAYGETRPLVDTADGVREPQNRRVEITLGPSAGR